MKNQLSITQFKPTLLFSLIALFITLLCVIMAQPLSAAEGSKPDGAQDEKTSLASTGSFKPGRIIEDKDFTRQTMRPSQIQSFLNSKVPDCDTNGDKPYNSSMTRKEYAASRGVSTPFICLKDYREDGKSAARLIYEAARDYNINQQVLLVLLQKEQGLITDDWPWPIQYKTATGYGCPDTAPCDSQYYGLKMQLRRSAKMFRAILNDDPNWYTPYLVGNNKIPWHPDTGRCGYSTVNIENRSTQALYNYTPYRPNQSALNAGYGEGNSCSSYGNRNFYLYFRDWFGFGKPDNIRLIECSGEKYIVERGIRKKRSITADAYDNAWQFEDKNTSVTKDDPGCNYPTYGLGLERVIRSRNTGSVYVVDSGTAYHVKDQATADAWGIGNLSNSTYPQFDGESIHFLKVESGLPRVATSSNTDVKTYYFVDNGKRHTIAGSPDADYASTRLVKGYDYVPAARYSPQLLQTLDKPGSDIPKLDYSFKADGQWYFLNHGELLKLSSQAATKWSAYLDGPTLSSEVPSLFRNQYAFNDAFRRNEYYYLKKDTQLERTKSADIALSWEAHTAPHITQLLTSKIVNEHGVENKSSIGAKGFRIFSCGDNKYLVERYIPRKRHITQAGLEAWGLDNAYFPSADGSYSCDYPTYAKSLDTLIRSRNTGREYLTDNDTAFQVHNQRAADAWGLSDVSSQTLPQFNGDSIHYLNIRRELPQLAQSDNTGNVYLTDSGNRHEVAATGSDGETSLNLIRGYDDVPMATFSSRLLQTLPNQPSIDYAFQIGSDWYLLDHNRTRKIDAESRSVWEEFISGPTLSSDVLHLFDENTTVGHGWQRDDYYYRINKEGNLERTTSTATAQEWGVTDTPIMTRLLTNRLVDLHNL